MEDIQQFVDQLAREQGIIVVSWHAVNGHVFIMTTSREELIFDLPPFSVENKKAVAPEVMKIPARSRRK